MAVDTFTQNYYAGGLLPKLTHWQEAEFLFDGDEPVPIDSLPDVSSDDRFTLRATSTFAGTLTVTAPRSTPAVSAAEAGTLCSGTGAS